MQPEKMTSGNSLRTRSHVSLGTLYSRQGAGALRWLAGAFPAEPFLARTGMTPAAAGRPAGSRGRKRRRDGWQGAMAEKSSICSEKPVKSGTNLSKNHFCSEKPPKTGTNSWQRQPPDLWLGPGARPWRAGAAKRAAGRVRGRCDGWPELCRASLFWRGRE